MSAPRPDIARRRLSAQHLSRDPFADVVDAVRALGAVQAQDYGGAKWGLGLRCPGATDATVDRALAAGTIIRTHVLRPTWHFVDPADIRWMLRLTAPRVIAVMTGYDRQMGLDDAAFRRSNDALRRILGGDAQMTRAELTAALKKSRVPVADSRALGHMLMRAELDGIVCSGARRGKQFTYALLDDCVPPSAELERDEALLELAKRYFTTRGPATVHDFAWWSGLTVADARRAVHLASTVLEQETIDGVSYWYPAAVTVARTRAPVARLLPNYDEFFIGYRDRSAILMRLKATKGANLEGLGPHVIEVDGQIVGAWKRTATKKAVAVDLFPVVRLSADERAAVEKSATRYGDFLGVPAEVEWHVTPAQRTVKPSWTRGVLR